ncbi:GDSL esterase/lipase At2g40250 [Amaranthus tricolor]|uniref:GDSL esterase/lipase At2g40250 n=1 Tax=Amaranthus tricolor TaxID=29722 RepID=UPI00258882AE|nr:GDSL esterase/lipase At2g40250 [Amaranthus tricolor]
MMKTLMFLLLLLFITSSSTAASVLPPISAIYVFGDSTVDPGNNDYLPTAFFQANHRPYGEDFPGHIPTGRFTDGLIAPDFMAQLLGLKQFIPPYLNRSVSDRDLLTGVSFASAGSGLDDLTIDFSHALDLTDQVTYFSEAIKRMENSAGQEITNRTVENAMFLISVGSNDMLINYYDLPTRALLNSPSAYSDFLLSRLKPIIQSLYTLGARRFVVAGFPPLGCLPIQVSVGSIIPNPHWLQRVCVDQQNSDAEIYNAKLQSLLNLLQSQNPHARFAYADIYTPLLDMINHPQSYGFERTLEGCCGTGILESGSLCNTMVVTCSNPSTYIFWDSIHPTQAAYKVYANALNNTVLPKLLS